MPSRSPVIPPCGRSSAERGWTLPSSPLVRGDISGSSLGEYRLRRSFVHVPVPFIGATRHDRIWAIGLSGEMRAYRAGASYDRPIPRRIAESLGVLRDAFGQKKKAASLLMFRSKAGLAPATFAAFVKVERHIVGDDAYPAYLVARAFYALRWSLFRAVSLFSSRRLGTAGACRLLERALVRDRRMFEHAHPRYGDTLFLWALQRQRRRYVTEVRACCSSGPRLDRTGGIV